MSPLIVPRHPKGLKGYVRDVQPISVHGNNYMVRSYRCVIVVTNSVSRTTIHAKMNILKKKPQN